MQHSASRETEDLVFARKSYIDSVAYMLKGLPDDMDNYETSVIRRALPKSCAPVGINGQIEAAPGRPGWVPSDRAKTFLRSTIQGSVAVIVLFLYLLLSFLAVILRAGADFERQYNVSQHLVSSGLTFATAVGKRSGALGERSESNLTQKLLSLVLTRTQSTPWVMERLARWSPTLPFGP